MSLSKMLVERFLRHNEFYGSYLSPNDVERFLKKNVTLNEEFAKRGFTVKKIKLVSLHPSRIGEEVVVRCFQLKC